MLIMTQAGLYCPAGDFFIDPKTAVTNAVITHAHSDHARPGSKQYFCTSSGVSLLKSRLGAKISVESHPYGQTFQIKDVTISFHPAGHILGSSQIRLALFGEVWVVSGDYKRDPDPTCEPFQSIPCDVFITEATFGTPAFQWDKSPQHGKAILAWWQQNAANDTNSVLFAYSLGKAQRILAELAELTDQPVYCHSATQALNDCYRTQGVKLLPTISLKDLPKETELKKALCLVPTSFLKTHQAKVLGKHYKTAFASGWMVRPTNQFNAGFILSDHADWNDLLLTITESRAKRVYVQHRGAGALVRELKKRGISAYPDTALTPKNPAQMVLF
jgi:putative mRNA 3-end processing factor